MDNSAALQAFADRERSLITEHIRTNGVHLTYVASELDGECACCLQLDDTTPQDGEQVPERVLEQVLEQVAGPSTEAAEAAGLPPILSQPFCYTTGLHGVGHPELVVLGLPPDVSAALLTTVAHRIIGHQQDLIPGQPIPGLQPQVLVEEIPNPGMVVLAANHYYGRPPLESVPAQQLTWADHDGRFPWDAGHDGGPWGQLRPGTYRA